MQEQIQRQSPQPGQSQLQSLPHSRAAMQSAAAHRVPVAAAHGAECKGQAHVNDVARSQSPVQQMLHVLKALLATRRAMEGSDAVGGMHAPPISLAQLQAPCAMQQRQAAAHGAGGCLTCATETAVHEVGVASPAMHAQQNLRNKQLVPAHGAAEAEAAQILVQLQHCEPQAGPVAHGGTAIQAHPQQAADTRLNCKEQAQHSSAHGV